MAIWFNKSRSSLRHSFFLSFCYISMPTSVVLIHTTKIFIWVCVHPLNAFISSLSLRRQWIGREITTIHSTTSLPDRSAISKEREELKASWESAQVPMQASRSMSEKTACRNRDITERNKKKRREVRDLPAFHTYPPFNTWNSVNPRPLNTTYALLSLDHSQSRCSSKSIIQFRTNHQRAQWRTTFVFIYCCLAHQPLQWFLSCGQTRIKWLLSMRRRCAFRTSSSSILKTLRFNRH